MPAAMLIAAGLLAVGDVAAQPATPAARVRTQDAERSFFALPWEIDFAMIHRAMAERSYEVEHVRRVLDRRDPRRTEDVWRGVVERLRHGAAGPDGEAAFELKLLGVEGETLGAAELERRGQQFQSRAGFLFRYQSFGVDDVALAERNYKILLHGIDVRLERPVYRVAVVSKSEARTQWILDLDVRTGYPLYRAEYAVDGQRVAEVEVVRFDPSFDGQGLPPDEDPAVQHTDDPAVAFARAGLVDRGVPGEGVLPAGYELRSAAVITNLFSGAKKARLIYTDGVDHLFVIAGADTRSSLGPGHVIGIHRDASGMTQCLFVHDQVEYLVIGRDSNDLVRPAASGLYAQVVRGG